MVGHEVLIVGAGPAGLTTAYELTKLGIKSTVLEADQQVGGLARTVNYRSYRFDIGGHRFFTKVPLVRDLWHEILGEDFLLRPRLSRILYRDQFFDYPLKPLNALAGLGIREAARVCASYAKAKVFPAHEETTFEQWVSNRFGTRLYEIFFKTYTEKVWGIPCAQISADWATQRIRNLSLGEALRNALFKNANGGAVVTSLIEQFHYPRFGPGMMWERCADLIVERGAEVVRGLRVERLRHSNGRIESVEARGEDGERVELQPESVISTMPLRELIHALDPLPPSAVVRASDALRYRDYLTVVLIVKRQDVFPDNWIYIHAPEVRAGRVQNYKNWSPWMVADPTRTSLGLEYFLWDRDSEWTWSTERLLEMGIRDLEQIGLVDAAEVEDGTVVRMPKAYPVYDEAYAANIMTVRRYLAGIQNLQTIGRNGQHRYNNQDHSMLAGVYAARNLTGACHDLWSVNTDADYHEEGRGPHTARGDRLVPTPLVSSAVERLSHEQIVEAAFARLDGIALGSAFAVVGGLVLCVVTAVTLLNGSADLKRMLSLLSQYLVGYRVSWRGLWIGVAETMLGGLWPGLCHRAATRPNARCVCGVAASPCRARRAPPFVG